MIVAQAFVHNQGDAWQWTLNYLMRLNETMGVGDKTGADAEDAFANYAAFARAMGTRLGELHRILARPSADPAFDPEKVSERDTREWTQNATKQLQAAFEIVSATKEWPSETSRDAAAFVLANQKKIIGAIPAMAKAGIGTLKTRVHGDFHLGQVLFAAGDAYIIDFEGEPAKTVEVRRAKSCPVRDVAGLLRSLHYAAAAARLNRTGATAGSGAQSASAMQRFVDDMSAQFLGAYYTVAEGAAPAPGPAGLYGHPLLDLFLLEKAAYEICYEAANRPTWINIPLRGFNEIAIRVLNAAREKVDA
jgi:maltose alpha-D-glucosyltransferase/alpha-amylase